MSDKSADPLFEQPLDQSSEKRSQKPSNTPNNEPEIWYKEFWAWFVLAPLIVVVCVSSFNVSLAVIGADDRVLDDYYKEGRMINMRLEEDLKANALALVADIEIDTTIGEISLVLKSANSQFPEQLVLEMSHPSEQELDHQITLTHIAKGRYQAELEKPLEYRWYLRLRSVSIENSSNDTEQPWRLRGEIDLNKQTSVQLSADF